MQVIRTLQRSPLGQRRGILRCLRWYTQIRSKVTREKIGALGPATGPKELTFFPIGFDKICIYHRKQLKIPWRWGVKPPRNISAKKRYWWKSMKPWKIFKGLSGVSGAKYQRLANGLEQVLSRSIEYVRTKKIGDIPQTQEKMRKKLKVENNFFGSPCIHSTYSRSQNNSSSCTEKKWIFYTYILLNRITGLHVLEKYLIAIQKIHI